MEQKYLEIYMKLVELTRLLDQDRHIYIREYGPLSDVAHGQGRILAYLKLDGILSVKELAEKLNIRPQSLNDHLNRMIRDGLVVKEQSPVDKRVMLVSLTPKAQEMELSERTYDEIFTGLSDEELNSLEEILSKITENLEEITANYGVDEPPVPPKPARPEPHLGGPHPVPPHLRGPHPGAPEPPRPERPHEEVPPHLRENRPPEPELSGRKPAPEPSERDELGRREKDLISEQVIMQFNGLVDTLMQELKNNGLIKEEVSEELVDEDLEN